MNLSPLRRPRIAAGLTLALVTLALPAAADAAPIDGAVTDITVTPTNPGIYDPVEANIAWCVPDGTAAGDTFTVDMPDELVGFPPGFDLLSPTGAVVATAAVAGDPAVGTFTMTDFAENNHNVCGEAMFGAGLRDLSLAGMEIDLTFTVNGSLDFVVPIEIPPYDGIGRERSRKTGRFVDIADQCRTQVEDCINWSLESPLGPFDVVTFEDVASDGAAFNCDLLEVFYYTVGSDGTLDKRRQPGSVGGSSDVTCSDTSFTVVTGPVPVGYLARVRLRATPEVSSVAGGVEYPNVAVVTTELDGQVIRVQEIGTTLLSTTGSGFGFGDNIDIEKVDAEGNDADNAAEAVVLVDGTATIDYSIRNWGTTSLLDIVVADVVVSGGTVSGLTCDFSEAADGAPTAGTTWAGPFIPAATFSCTAQLTGVTFDTPHENVATVTGTGEVSGLPTNDEDEYHAILNPPATTTTTTTTTTLPPTTTAPTTTTTTTTTLAPIPTITIPPTVTLPETGGSGGGTIAALGAALLGLGFAARRFSRPMV